VEREYLQAIKTLRSVNVGSQIILQELLIAGLEEGKPGTRFTKDEQAHIGAWRIFVVVVKTISGAVYWS
jgi:hypothetical protein